MSKYLPLWNFIKEQNKVMLMLTFQEIQTILGFPIDHSFLNFKKELLEYGFYVGKISLKQETLIIHKQC
ncbi:MAG: hypothetical protein PHY42_04320 [Bacilli bacterium]|nr:hypothetical protein [Bacilli bacterium]